MSDISDQRNKPQTLRFGKFVTCLGVFGWFVICLLIFWDLVPWINEDSDVFEVRIKLSLLMIASMTVAATLLTTTAADNPAKQFVFLLIAMAGTLVAVVAISPSSWVVLAFLILGLLPAISVFGIVIWLMFEGHRRPLFLLVIGGVLVLMAVALMHTTLGEKISGVTGACNLKCATLLLASSGFLVSLVGYVDERVHQRRTRVQSH